MNGRPLVSVAPRGTEMPTLILATPALILSVDLLSRLVRRRHGAAG